jgi:hypothetical protein
MSFPLAFAIIAVVASLTAIEFNTAIFLTGYRTALYGTCMLFAINLSLKGAIEPP